LRTGDAWIPVAGFTLSPAMSFNADATHEVAPNTLDRAIVTGGFAHRRPALEVVRTIVDERTAHRNYDHRLMDYNNDLRTQLGDVKSLFDEALARMNDPKWLSANGFVYIGP
jgi:hypothetical protein